VAEASRAKSGWSNRVIVKRVCSDREAAVIAGDVMVFVQLREDRESVGGDAVKEDGGRRERVVRVGRGEVLAPGFRQRSRARAVLTGGLSVFLTAHLNPAVNRDARQKVRGVFHSTARERFELALIGVTSRTLLTPQTLEIPGLDRGRKMYSLTESRARVFEECFTRGAE
jgi:hypothetical protein